MCAVRMGKVPGYSVDWRGEDGEEISAIPLHLDNFVLFFLRDFLQSLSRFLKQLVPLNAMAVPEQNPYESLLPSLDLLDIRYCRIHSRVKYVSLAGCLFYQWQFSSCPRVALDGTPPHSPDLGIPLKVPSYPEVTPPQNIYMPQPQV